MALSRPEGLMPAYAGLMSPDIPFSTVFRWYFRGESKTDYQTKYQIRIYRYISGSWTVQHTYNGTGKVEEVDASSIGYTFSLNTEYMWDVKTWNKANKESDFSYRAKFIYRRCPNGDQLDWNTTDPKMNESVKNTYYFTEIKTNLMKLLKDYKDYDKNIEDKINRLFTTEVVPLRQDFDDLQDILVYIGTKEGIEFTIKNRRVTEEKRPNLIFGRFDGAPKDYDLRAARGDFELEIYEALKLIEWIEDGLGVTDLSKIKGYIKMLEMIPPQPISKVRMNMQAADMYQMKSITASNDGVNDNTIDVAWTVNGISGIKGYFYYDDMSPSEDVRLYDLEFEYAHQTGSFKTRYFMTPDDIKKYSEMSFDLNWHGLFTTIEGVQKSFQTMKITAVDFRNNKSAPYNLKKTYNSNFKTPIGVKEYQVEYQKSALTASSYSTSGKWDRVYTGSKLNTTYKVSGAEGKLWHRVRVVDKSGLISNWMYASKAVVWDPLKPPGKVKNPRTKDHTTNSMVVYWDATPNCESYEVSRFWENIIGSTTGLQKKDTGLKANTKYNYYVRGVNRKGKGPWTPTSGKTKPNVKEAIWTTWHTHTWSDKRGWMPQTGHNHTMVYQGKASSAVGNNRGMFYFNHADIWKVIGGKKIVSISIEVQRKSGGSSAAQAPTFGVHDNNRYYDGYPPVWGSFKSPIKFSVGTKKWVELPVSFGNRIKNKQGTGIAIHGNPYMCFANKARLKIKYEA
ncbi:structural protein [Bacillus phage vB_BauM_KLEB27-3]|nr:structural protein [Bacillus phage vB_BauM_KLEB27-3]